MLGKIAKDRNEILRDNIQKEGEIKDFIFSNEDLVYKDLLSKVAKGDEESITNALMQIHFRNLSKREKKIRLASKNR